MSDKKNKLTQAILDDQTLLENIQAAGGDFLLLNLRTNVSALTYLIAEQQLLIGKLLSCLMESGAIQAHQLDSITRFVDQEEEVTKSYTTLYDKYVRYFTALYYVAKESDLNKKDDDKDGE